MTSPYRQKVKHIVPVWLTITVVVPAVVLMLRWLLSIRTQATNIDESIWHIWIPLLLTFLPVWFWLRPRLRILRFNKLSDKRRSIFVLVPIISLAGTLICAQSFLVEATSRVTFVKTADDILTAPYSRYYAIEKFSVDRTFNGIYSTEVIARSGRFGFLRTPKRDYTLYWTVPFQLRDSLSTNLKIWYGVTRWNTLTGAMSEAERQYSTNRFYNYSVNELVYYDYHSTKYLKRLPASEERTNFIQAMNTRLRQLSDDIIILVPAQDINDRVYSSFFWAIAWYAGGILLFLVLLTWPKINTVELKRFTSSKR